MKLANMDNPFALHGQVTVAVSGITPEDHSDLAIWCADANRTYDPMWALDDWPNPFEINGEGLFFDDTKGKGYLIGSMEDAFYFSMTFARRS